MKKFLFVVFLVQSITYDSSAQYDSTLKVQTYVGILSTLTYAKENVSTDASVRAGASLTWSIDKRLRWSSFAVLDFSKSSVFSAQGHYLTYQPAKHWEIAVGHMATPSTEQRGFPVSGSGHFETWVHTQIPGATPGIKVRKTWNDQCSSEIGIAKRGTTVEYHGLLQYGKAKLTGYVTKKTYGAAFSVKSDRFTTLSILNEKFVGNTIIYSILKKQQVFVWTSGGVEHQKRGKIVRAIGGLFKSFSYKSWSGLTAIGYDVKEKAFNCYLFVHL